MAERLRVMRVIARMNVGGPALQVTSLVEGMDPHRFDHRLYTGRVSPDEADHLALRAPHLPVRVVEGLGRSLDATADLRALAALVREMRAFRPHVVHTHTAKAGVLGRVAATLTRTPVLVHTFHGHLLHGYFSPAVTGAVVLTERLLARRTTRLVSVGSHVRDDLLAARIGTPDQYVVVPPGITLPPPPARHVAREMLGLPAERPVVAFVARLTAIKRPDRLLEVVRRVTAARPDVVFAVVGEGEAGRPLVEAAEGAEQLRMLGWRADVETVYAASDVVLLTSDNEGMPVSLIEAGLCGVPAVATDVGSVSEVVLDGRSGRLVARDAEALAHAVLALLADDATRAAWGVASAEHTRRSFGAERLVADLESLYLELAELQGRGRHG